MQAKETSSAFPTPLVVKHAWKMQLEKVERVASSYLVAKHA
jgi:hypothetical protein